MPGNWTVPPSLTQMTVLIFVGPIRTIYLTITIVMVRNTELIQTLEGVCSTLCNKQDINSISKCKWGTDLTLKEIHYRFWIILHVNPLSAQLDRLHFNSFEVASRYPANTIHLPNVLPMLGQRRRRWTNICQTLGRWVLFAEYHGWKLCIFV